MALMVFWTQFAEDNLDDIFKYYKFKAGIRVAQNLINGIIDTSLTLDKNAYGGQREELLSERIQDFRYLIYKSYKIIYWIDEAKQIIYVANVFDCRQNPEKLTNEK